MANSTPPITCQILVAEEEHMLRRGLRVLVSAQSGFQVVEASSTPPAADIVITQSEMLKGFGIWPNLPVLCITPDQLAASADRADGEYRRFVKRSSSPEEFLKSLQSLAAAIGQIKQPVSPISPRGATPLADLTDREREVLGFLADRLTVRQIAGELGLSIKTVESHTLNIMRKLDVHRRAQLIKIARMHLPASISKS